MTRTELVVSIAAASFFGWLVWGVVAGHDYRWIKDCAKHRPIEECREDLKELRGKD